MAKHRKSRKRSNPSRHRSRRHGLVVHRNPAVLGHSPSQLTAIVAGLIAGGIGSSFIPNAVLPSMDAGFVGYLLDLAVAIAGSMAIDRFGKAPNLAKGWLYGGITMVAGRVFDDVFNKQIVQFSVPTGTSGIYTGARAPLPTPTGSRLFVSGSPSSFVPAGPASGAKGLLKPAAGNPSAPLGAYFARRF